MPTWIALFRGVNVVGKNKMPMARLSSLLESLGCKSVRTYIQSGNVVFSSAMKNKSILARRILDSTEHEFGFRPKLLLLSPAEFRTAIRNNPFADAIPEPNTLHFFFLDSRPPAPDLDAFAKLATKTERYKLIDKIFYLHAPDGFGTSKLAAGAERKLGVPATARNYNTVDKLSAMIPDS